MANNNIALLASVIGQSGVLFLNDKGDNDKRPDHKGEVGPKGGDKVEVVGFNKTDKNGKGYISLSLGKERDNHGFISLFTNDKGGVDTRPDYRGRDAEAGVAVSAWTRTWEKNGKSGTYISLSFSEYVPPVEPTDPVAPVVGDDFSDDIPF